jgi:hypothetical protein
MQPKERELILRDIQKRIKYQEKQVREALRRGQWDKAKVHMAKARQLYEVRGRLLRGSRYIPKRRKKLGAELLKGY